MQYFRDSKNRPHALDDGIDHLKLDGFPKVDVITKQEYMLLCHPPPLTTEQRIEEVKSQLRAIDKSKTRAITDALLTGDKSRLEDLEAQQVVLRATLIALSS